MQKKREWTRTFVNFLLLLLEHANLYLNEMLRRLLVILPFGFVNVPYVHVLIYQFLNCIFPQVQNQLNLSHHSHNCRIRKVERPTTIHIQTTANLLLSNPLMCLLLDGASASACRSTHADWGDTCTGPRPGGRTSCQSSFVCTKAVSVALQSRHPKKIGKYNEIYLFYFISFELLFNFKVSV